MRIEDLTTTSGEPPVPIRTYRPDRPVGPALLWMHGGAFAYGSINMPEGDAVCRALAERGITCVSVEYRLVPGKGRFKEQRGATAVRYPLPLDDCANAWSWLRANTERIGVRPDALYVGGASAGSTLAATLALRFVNSPEVPRGVVMAYPSMHADLLPPGPELKYALRGFRRFGVITRRRHVWCSANYVGKRNLHRLTEAFPGGRDLTGFPDTLIVNSERDTLRASGEAFARELEAHQATVHVEFEAGTDHGHLNEPDNPGFARTLDTFADWMLSVRK
ncbi:alpha/beta hydrolase [Yinghuangia seranimata]|uniref:alpha/beta hydrolase n=1 Tax=Yinghuangia seranimata TaxID=408067 RepID=UPI00248AEE3E|nr:alpha/beta hydrolase fold domain-containing protein [Yinghuangia seranimata]MDI2129392.1 alpha/beta hydrolase fold domain-containing protein [Yinghuangia seranimata]